MEWLTGFTAECRRLEGLVYVSLLPTPRVSFNSAPFSRGHATKPIQNKYITKRNAKIIHKKLQISGA